MTHLFEKQKSLILYNMVLFVNALGILNQQWIILLQHLAY